MQKSWRRKRKQTKYNMSNDNKVCIWNMTLCNGIKCHITTKKIHGICVCVGVGGTNTDTY